MAHSDQSTIERDFYGFTGAGPLTISVTPKGYVQVKTWTDHRLHLDSRAAFQLAHFIEQMATEARLREQERGE